MNACPNITLPEWKKLEAAVGTFEAYRDYMETDGEIRSPEEVQKKIDARASIKPEVRDLFDNNPEFAQSIYDIINSEETRDSDKLLALQQYSDYLDAFESTKDYKLGTGEDIKNFKEHRDFILHVARNTQGPSIGEIAKEVYDSTEQPLIGASEQQMKNALAIEFADKVSQVLGIDYEIVNADDAYRITEKAKNYWRGEPAFFFGGKVYFVQERLSADNVFHEFSHPIVRSIAKENPELFNKLYDDLAATPEGQAIITEVTNNYNDLNPGSDLFKEEVIVKAVTKEGLEQLGKNNAQSGFGKFMKELFYQFKQFFRKHFGRDIKISKLSADTKISDLADILTQGGKLELNVDLISEEELVVYNREVNELNDYGKVVRELTNLDQREVQDTVNAFFKATKEGMTAMYSEDTSDYFEELSEILTHNKRSDVNEMHDNLKSWETNTKKGSEDTLTNVEQIERRVKALTNTLFTLEDVSMKIREHVKEVASRPDVQDNVNQISYYNKFIKHWMEFIETFNSVLNDNGVDARSSIQNVTNHIMGDFKIAQTHINRMFADASRDALYEQLLPMTNYITEKYTGPNGMITKLEARRKPGVEDKYLEKEIDRLYKEFHGVTQEEYAKFNELATQRSLSEEEERTLKDLTMKMGKGLSISKEKIEQLMKGDMSDVNFINSHLEGYMYNVDPVVGGLALFIKNGLSEVMAITQQKYNAFAEDMRQDLKDLGVVAGDLGKFGERVMFKDTILRRKPDGTTERVLVWTLHNEFQNYRADYDEKRIAQKNAEKRWNQTNSDEDYRKYMLAKADFELFKTNYFHQEYVDEYYENRRSFMKDALGQRALLERNKILEDIKILSANKDRDVDVEQRDQDIELKWREYRQLHYATDGNGDLKSTVKDKDGISPAMIAERLRAYRELSSKFYEDVAREGAFEDAYFTFVQELEAEPNMVRDSEEWRARLNEWKKKNTRTAIKPEFYNERNRILADIKKILSKLPDSLSKEADQSEKWRLIFDHANPAKDQDGQINGNDLSKKVIASIKALQLELKQMKEDGAGLNGLTKQQTARLKELGDKFRNETITPAEKAERNKLLAIMRTQGINQYDQKILFARFQELAEMSTREANTYYIDTINTLVFSINDKSVQKWLKANKIKAFDKTNAHLLLEPEAVDLLTAASPKFAEWFEENHMVNKSYNAKTKQEEIDSYERVYVWNVVRPADPTMMESVTIRDPKTGKIIDTIAGKPGAKYFTREVKSKYKTRQIVGITVDNRGNYLPKSRELMAKNKNLSEDEKYIYINKDYEKLKKENGKLYKVIEKLKRYHLANQEGLDRGSKLYLDSPRYAKNELQDLSFTLKEGLNNPKNLLTYWARRIKEFFHGEADAAEFGTLNHDALRSNIIRADMFDNEISDIPISGLYNLKDEDVSTDITLGIMRYMLSAEKHKQLVKMSPIARAIQETVNNPAKGAKIVEEMHKRNLRNRFMAKLLPKGNDTRKKVINNLIEREFQGQTQAGLFSESVAVKNVTNLLFKRASFAFFALNIPSALKNSLGMKFQEMIEASAGNYVDHFTLQKGNLWAHKTMGIVMGNLYNKGVPPFELLLVNGFDMMQGQFEEKFGQGMSRSVAGDIANLSWLYAIRKGVEMQAGLQLSAGMLYKVQLKQNMPDGTVKDITYMDAFEVVDKKLKLKEGIDVRYGLEHIVHEVETTDTIESIAKKYYTTVDVIEEALHGRSLEDLRIAVDRINTDREEAISNVDIPGQDATLNEIMLAQDKIDEINRKYDEKLSVTQIKIDNNQFKFYKNRMHQVTNNMSGTYAKYDQPEWQRYFLFRAATFMRRYFTSMFVSRWGFSGSIRDPRPRLNPGMGDAQMGFYTQFIRTVGLTFISGGKHLKYLSADEKAAAMKFITEMALLALAKLLIGLVFDPEDDDKFKKLRAMSGPLGLLGAESKGREFDAMGFLQLHALHLLMQVRAENAQFNLLTGGLQQYNMMLDLKSVALGPTTDAVMVILDDIDKWATGDPRAYYTRDIGPYDWQKKESLKVMNHLAKMFGLTGTSLDPALAIQNFLAYLSIIRR